MSDLDLDAIEATLFSKHRTRCVFGKWIDGLDENDQQRVNGWLGNKALSDNRLAAALGPKAQVAPSTMTRHRSGGCKCREAEPAC